MKSSWSSFEPTFLKYKIMYAEMEGGSMQLCLPKTCNVIETSDKLIEITNLKPYTKYQFQISISNYYTEFANMKMKFTRVKSFQTEIGAPSRPRKLKANVLSPTEILLTWLPPIVVNGPSIRYEVHYQTENEIDGLQEYFKFFVKGKRRNEFWSSFFPIFKSCFYSLLSVISIYNSNSIFF